MSFHRPPSPDHDATSGVSTGQRYFHTVLLCGWWMALVCWSHNDPFTVCSLTISISHADCLHVQWHDRLGLSWCPNLQSIGSRCVQPVFYSVFGWCWPLHDYSRSTHSHSITIVRVFQVTMTTSEHQFIQTCPYIPHHCWEHPRASKTDLPLNSLVKRGSLSSWKTVICCYLLCRKHHSVYVYTKLLVCFWCWSSFSELLHVPVKVFSAHTYSLLYQSLSIIWSVFFLDFWTRETTGNDLYTLGSASWACPLH